MKKRFCPKCGKEDVDFYKGFCIDCYKEMHRFTKIPKELKILTCKRCGLWYYRNEWFEESFQNLERIVKNKVKTELYNPGYEIDLKEDLVLLKIKGYVDKYKQILTEENFEIKIKYPTKICPNCLKISGKYFEFKIQLRPGRGIADFKSVSTFIKKSTHRLMFKDPKAEAFWWQNTKNGVDFLFGSKQVGERVSKETINKFGLKAEASYKFRGIDKKGRKKTEYTYCIRV